MCGLEHKRGEGCAVLYVHVSTIKRVTVGTANVSSVKAIAKYSCLNSVGFLVGLTARMHTYACVCYSCACVCIAYMCVCVFACVCRSWCMHISSVTLPNNLQSDGGRGIGDDLKVHIH